MRNKEDERVERIEPASFDEAVAIRVDIGLFGRAVVKKNSDGKAVRVAPELAEVMSNDVDLFVITQPNPEIVSS